MRSTYLMLVGVWIMFGCCAVVAVAGWRRGRRIDRLIAEHKRRSGQS